MFKIDKYFTLRKRFPQIKGRRHVSCKDENCCRACPPTYICARPEEVIIFDYEKYKRDNVHPFLKVRCKKDPRPFRNIFYFICVPILIALYIDNFYLHREKQKRPKFMEFAHMRIRRKPFPWDPDRTLFHNPRYNALPTGYEIEVPEDEEFDPWERVPY